MTPGLCLGAGRLSDYRFAVADVIPQMSFVNFFGFNKVIVKEDCKHNEVKYETPFQHHCFCCF